jgi:hypothetical protein
VKELCISNVSEGSCSKSGESSKGLTLCPGKVVKPIASPVDSDWDWMADFDWEGDLKKWEMGKPVQVSPIIALFGKLIKCPGLTINWSGNVNLRIEFCWSVYTVHY